MISWVLRYRVGLAGVLLALVAVGVGLLVLRPSVGGVPPGALEIRLTPVPTRGPGPAVAAGVPTPGSTLALPTTLPAPTAPPAATIKVYVTGAVARPGVCVLLEGDRVEDAIREAGGALADADLDHINLAARLHDEDQIRIPRWGDTTVTPITAAPPAPATMAPTSASPASPPNAPPAVVNINTADATALATLPAIGPVLATRIVAYRTAHGPFATPADIKQVKGIGDAIYAEIAPYITVGP